MNKQFARKLYKRKLAANEQLLRADDLIAFLIVIFHRAAEGPGGYTEDEAERRVPEMLAELQQILSATPLASEAEALAQSFETNGIESPENMRLLLEMSEKFQNRHGAY